MHKLAFAVALVAACSHPAAPNTPGPTPTATAPAAPALDPHARTVADLVGVWAGKAVDTPLGDFPFAIAFEREPAGSVHGRIDDGKGMYLDFRFVQDGTAWNLTEEGAIPSLGVQTHTLIPVAAGPDGPRWVDRADPTYVDIAWAITGDNLVVTTKIHGEPHAAFQLQRVRGADAERVLQAIASPPPGPGAVQ